MSKEIVIVDDHNFILEGWKEILKSSDFKIIRTFNNGNECLEYIGNEEFPNLFIIDIKLPDMEGFELVEAIREKSELQKIILSTFDNDIRYFEKAIALNVQGYLLKDEEEENIQNCIAKVLEGHTYHPRKLKQQLLFNLNIEKVKITPKEKIILKHIRKGNTNKEMAEKESLSVKTVETHRYNLMKKLGAKNVADLIRKVKDHEKNNL